MEKGQHNTNVHEEIKPYEEPLEIVGNELNDTVKANLNNLCKTEKFAKKNLAKDIGVAQSAVSNWTAKNNSIPSYEYMTKIARHFNTTVDWILSDHSKQSSFKRQITYYEAFKNLQPLVEGGYLDPDNIHDEVLAYLLTKEKAFVEDIYMPEEEVRQWLSDVSSLFNFMMPEKSDYGFGLWLYQYKCPELHTTSEIRQYANIAKKVSEIPQDDALRKEYADYKLSQNKSV